MQVQPSSAKIVMSLEWKGPSGSTTPIGSSQVLTIDLVFKDAKTQISVTISKTSQLRAMIRGNLGHATIEEQVEIFSRKFKKVAMKTYRKEEDFINDPLWGIRNNW